MELVKFCIRLITPRASAAFPACFPPSFFHLCRNIFVPPQRAAGWQMALWKGTDATLGCRFGLFLPQKWVSGAVTAPWQRREAEKRRKKKIKQNREERDKSNKQRGGEKVRAWLPAWVGAEPGRASASRTERPSKGHPGNPPRCPPGIFRRQSSWWQPRQPRGRVSVAAPR